jgi:hypothetical protein
LKYTSSAIWESGKSIGAKAGNIEELALIYADLTAKTEPLSIYSKFHLKYQNVVEQRDFESLLVIYDNKNKLLDLLGKALDLKGRSALENLVSRLLSSPTASLVVSAFTRRLPRISAISP